MSTLKTHNLQSPDAGSVNIVMAPNAGMVVAGLSTYSNQINVGSNIKLGTAGVVTATSFVGSGANLTSLPAQATIANNADNRVITGGSGVNLEGESNLTFTGKSLTTQTTSYPETTELTTEFKAGVANGNRYLNRYIKLTNTYTGSAHGGIPIVWEANADGSNNKSYGSIGMFSDGAITFYSRGAGSAVNVGSSLGMSERLRIGNDGKLITYGTGAVVSEFNTSLGAGAYIQFDLSASGATTGYIGAGSQLVTGSAVADFGFRSQANMVFSTGGSTERLRIASDGLSQFKNSTGGQIHLGGDSAHTAKITITDNAGSGNGNFLFAGPSSTHLKVASNGNILVGDGSTYSPGCHVHLHGGTTGVQQLRVQNHTSIGSFSGDYGSEFRHATSVSAHAMLIHAHEANDARRTLDISDYNGVFGRFVNGKTGLGRDSSGNVSTRGVLEICAPFDDVSDNDGSADLGTNGHDALIINIAGPGAASGKNVGSIAWGGGRRRAAIMGEYQNTDADYLALAFFTRGTDGAGDFYKSFIINHNGSAGLHGSLSQNTSDDRLKKDKVEITNALDKVNSLSSFTHKWNEIAVRAGLEENKTEIGLSAQEVQGLYPSLVNVNNTMIDPDNPTTEYLTIHYEKVVPLLVASIKELTAKNKALEARLDALEGS